MSEAPAAQAQLRSADEWLSPARFGLLLAALVFIAFPGVLTGLEAFVGRDFGVFAYPLAYFQRQCFWRGELPLWNPFNYCGVPFLAQWNTMPLYPLSLFYLLLPLTWSLNVFCLLHLWFGGLGMYFLSNRWTGNRLAASVAGLVFAFNGMTQNLLMGPNLIAALAWMPWVIFAVESAWREGGLRLVQAGLVATMQMLTGGPEIIVFTWAILAALWMNEGFAIWLRARRNQPGISSGNSCTSVQPWVLVCRFLLLVLLVATLSAVQLLPFLDLLAHSQRHAGFADSRWPMPLSGWANFFVPMAFGATGREGVFFQNDQFWTSSYYLGIGSVTLALLALWSRPERRTWVLAIAGCASLILALGVQTALYRWLARFIPLEVIRFPVKFLIVFTCVWPLLASFGVARWRGSKTIKSAQTPNESARGVVGPQLELAYALPWSRLVWVSGFVLVVIASVLFWSWRLAPPPSALMATLRNGLVRALFMVLTTSVLLCLRLDTSVRVQRLLSGSLILLVWLDLYTHMPRQNPTVTPKVYEPGFVRSNITWHPQPVLGTSRVMLSQFARLGFTTFNTPEPKDNYLARRLGSWTDCNLLDEIPQVGGFFPLCSRESYLVQSLLDTSEDSAFSRLKDFLSVSQVTAPRHLAEWSPRSSFLPMVTAGQKPVFLEENELLHRLADASFDPANTVLLQPAARAHVQATRATDARVISSKVSIQQLEVRVEASEPSIVVVAETYYHWWRAYVDGHPTPLLPANYAFQAVPIPAGNHLVRLAYEDRGFRLGAAVSVVSLLSCLGAWVYLRKWLV